MELKTIINEELKTLFESLEIYSIPELAKTFKRQGYDENGVNAIQKVLMNAYQNGGNDAVIKLYYEMAGVQIQALRNGRYVFGGVGGGGEDMLEVLDNANHTPDEMPS